MSIGSDLERFFLGTPRPRLTSYFIADEILAELKFWRLMADDYDRADLDTETHVKDHWTMGHLASAAPTGREFVGFVDRAPRSERKLYQEKVVKLEAELGPKFLNRSGELHGQMLRTSRPDDPGLAS